MMKALTLTQPWASLVALGKKKIETRSWKTDHRGPLAIHSAKGFPTEAREIRHTEPFKSVLQGDSLLLFRGFVLCTVHLIDCFEMTPEWIATVPKLERSFGCYEPGRYAWLLEGPQILDMPVKARGQLGLWNWKPLIGVAR